MNFEEWFLQRYNMTVEKAMLSSVWSMAVDGLRAAFEAGMSFAAYTIWDIQQMRDAFEAGKRIVTTKLCCPKCWKESEINVPDDLILAPAARTEVRCDNCETTWYIDMEFTENND